MTKTEPRNFPTPPARGGAIELPPTGPTIADRIGKKFIGTIKVVDGKSVITSLKAA